MKIEKATEKDLPQILQLQHLAYRSEAALVNNYSIQPLTQTLKDLRQEYERSTVLKAIENDRIVGSIRGYPQDKTLHIGKLMVHPHFRRQGIGSALLQAIESLYPNNRYELFTSSYSVNNITMYAKHGYQEFQRKPYFNDILFVYMEKS